MPAHPDKNDNIHTNNIHTDNVFNKSDPTEILNYNKNRNSYNKDENDFQRQKGQKRQGEEPSEFNGTANWAKRK